MGAAFVVVLLVVEEDPLQVSVETGANLLITKLCNITAIHSSLFDHYAKAAEVMARLAVKDRKAILVKGEPVCNLYTAPEFLATNDLHAVEFDIRWEPERAVPYFVIKLFNDVENGVFSNRHARHNEMNVLRVVNSAGHVDIENVHENKAAK